MTWLLCYLVLGGLVAYANDKLVLKEMVANPLERINYMVRAILAWPTYLLEDFVLIARMNGEDDEDG